MSPGGLGWERFPTPPYSPFCLNAAVCTPLPRGEDFQASEEEFPVSQSPAWECVKAGRRGPWPEPT